MKTNSPQSDPARRILLVAADTSFREWSESILREAGYCTQGEDDPEVAWTALCQYGCRLLVIDHKLPEGSGLRLVLRMSHANLTLPVVLVTEAPLSFDPREHRRLHSVTVLPKPFDAGRLLEVVFVSLQGTPPAKPVSSRLTLIEAGTRSPRPAGFRAAGISHGVLRSARRQEAGLGREKDSIS